MKQKATRIVTILMMFVLAHFVLANTVFMHSHRCFDGNVVTHSHPYLPSAHHNHSQQALDSISVLNIMAGSMNASPYLSVGAAYIYAYAIIADACSTAAPTRDVHISALRGPPAPIL